MTGIRGAGAREGYYTVLMAKLTLPDSKIADKDESMKASLGLTLIPHSILPARYSSRTDTPFRTRRCPGVTSP
jgi:hypothetical protein